MIFENLKHIVTHIGSKLKLFGEAPKIGRPLKITEANAITCALYQHASSRGTKISMFRDFEKSVACSYNTFVVSMNRYAVTALRILFYLMRLGRKDARLVKLVDATGIPVCLNKNATSHRTMRGWAGRGQFDFRSLKLFHGLEDHFVRSLNGCFANIIFALLSFVLA